MKPSQPYYLIFSRTMPKAWLCFYKVIRLDFAIAHNLLLRFLPLWQNYKSHRSNKIIYILISLLCALLSVSCRTEKPPKDILASEQLTQIMIEFYLAEAKLSNYSLAQDSAKKLFMPFEEATLKKYGVADSTLKKTYQYYFDRPTELEKIYEIVIDSLSLRERKATGIPRATPE